jgi:molecular chaperone GrpE
VQSALRDLLPVFDNLERATAHVDASSDIESLLDGLRMVHKLFLDTLGRLGIERVAGIGSAFDPMVHEGIQHDYSDEHPAGAVAAELQPGYRMAGELIRPALVVVSRGPRLEEPAAGEPSEPPAVAEADTASDDVEG